MALVDLIIKGGPLMYPIVFCSIITLAVVFERLISLRKNNILPPNFLIEIEDLIERGKIPEALTLCKTNGSLMATIVATGLTFYNKSRSQVKTAIEEIG